MTLYPEAGHRWTLGGTNPDETDFDLGDWAWPIARRSDIGDFDINHVTDLARTTSLTPCPAGREPNEGNLWLMGCGGAETATVADR